ncbi:MAG TPA: hypothetical protein VFX85_12565 [Solirubrobacterales bacterium]|nr:hypothetical protein [Solirubrobacterales bacterium]
MRVDYDSEADALSIELRPHRRYDDQEQVDDDFCNVGIVDGQVVDVELLSPARHLDLLSLAARSYELDGVALVAAAQAGLAAPDCLITVEVESRGLAKAA